MIHCLIREKLARCPRFIVRFFCFQCREEKEEYENRQVEAGSAKTPTDWSANRQETYLKFEVAGK